MPIFIDELIGALTMDKLKQYEQEQALLNLCSEFVKGHPIELDKNGHLDAQEFFETVDESDLIGFFQKLYGLYQ